MEQKQLEANKEIVKRLINEGFNKNDLSLWDELVSSDCILKTAPEGAAATREGWKQNTTMLHQAFPDIQAEIQSIVAEEDKVIVYETTTGTHQGAFAGVPATGNLVSVPAFMMAQLKDGKIIAQWNLFDSGQIMAQLSVNS